MQQEQKNGDVEFLYFLMLIVACATIYAIWIFAKPLFVWISFTFSLPQVMLVDLIFNYGTEIKQNIMFMKGVFRDASHALYVDPHSIKFEEMHLMSRRAGSKFMFISIPLILFMAYKIVKNMKGAGLTRSFSLAGDTKKPGSEKSSLAYYQAEHWKVFSTGAKFNPDTLNDSELQAKTPMEWMRANNVAMNDDIDGLDDDAAEEAFEKQLGEQWQGLDKAPLHVKALCVAAYSTAIREKKARQIKEKIAMIYGSHDQDKIESGIGALYDEYCANEKFKKTIEKRMNKHAYINTGLFGLLRWSREWGGVFASAEFRWLKAVDRSMWYGLNNCGRMSYHIEGAGIVSHFNSEHISKTPLVQPHIGEAIDGLDDYMEHQGITDIDAFFNNLASATD